ncbi:hypothetical protein XENE109146_13030 [Xenorhabdus nematophila]
MTGDQMIQRLSQGLVIQLADQAQCHGKVIGQTGSRIELVQKPQALLGERQG